MPQAQLEHANLTVSDPQRTADLLARLCGWRERWRGPSHAGGLTLHVGEAATGATYLALYTDENVRVTPGRQHRKGRPLNHIGLRVDDLTAAEQVVVGAGLQPHSHDDYDPGRRFYFFDWDGIEYEIVSYAEPGS